MHTRGLGIAGYMGAGKSTVCRWLASKGCAVIDADTEAKRFMNGNAAVRQALAGAFGPEVLAGEQIDFQALGERVFNSFANLLRLNTIVHPPLLAHFDALLSAVTAPLWVFDAALIPLWRTESWFIQVYWIHADIQTRLSRLGVSTGLPQEELRRRMDLQQRLFPPPARPPWRRISNQGTEAELKERLERELSALLPGSGGHT